MEGQTDGYAKRCNYFEIYFKLFKINFISHVITVLVVATCSTYAYRRQQCTKFWATERNVLWLLYVFWVCTTFLAFRIEILQYLRPFLLFVETLKHTIALTMNYCWGNTTR